MGQLGKYLRKFDGGYSHWCPGCKEMHFIHVEKAMKNGSQWTFNGDQDVPTFNPSVRIKIPKEWGGNSKSQECCHYFIRAGIISFCSDSTHELSGKAVNLPELPEGMQD